MKEFVQLVLVRLNLPLNRLTVEQREFDVIVVDLPFFIPEPVYQAINVLTGDRRPDLFLVFAVEHEAELLRLFAEYRLQPTDFNPRHSNVKVSHQPLFWLYGSQPNLVCGENYAAKPGAAPDIMSG